MARSHHALSSKCFAHVAPTYEGGHSLPTMEAKVGPNLTATLAKHGEDEVMGYHYRVTLRRTDLDNERVGEILGWFDGFGCADRPNDVIHTIRRMVRSAAQYRRA